MKKLQTTIGSKAEIIILLIDMLIHRELISSYFYNWLFHLFNCEDLLLFKYVIVCFHYKTVKMLQFQIITSQHALNNRWWKRMYSKSKFLNSSVQLENASQYPTLGDQYRS